MNYPAAEQRGIRCHAGLDPASSLDFWIPAFAGMTTRGKPRGIKRISSINRGKCSTSDELSALRLCVSDAYRAGFPVMLKQ